MPFMGLTGNRRELRPSPRHAFALFIVLFSILVPPLAVAMRFGIGTDFFVNVLLTILGYIPGHLHNFFIQRVRDNSSKKRTPAWLRKCGLVVSPANASGANRKWADRYLYVPEHVQHDDEGRAYYLNPETNEFDAPTAIRPGLRSRPDDDEESDVATDPDALVEPDRFYATSSKPAKPIATPSTLSMDSGGSRRTNRSLMSRTRKLFGGHGHTSTPSMNRHSRIDHAMGTPSAEPSYGEFEEEELATMNHRQSVPTTAPTDTMDELDRELLGLSTQERIPPRAYDASPAAERPAAASAAPERDIMEYEHTF
ncbi:hypothetical protein MBRA1_000390 [Malassezia brasiliensis]|uniref:Uncharacterized protein n=1 Tax=Malassezia brasiliensis TaxID=1821822 RepID=A0AAF0IMA7_9BASI|nr:hypothetical protein MBRA1_000390 [Malassezia brasiliensis]